MFGDFIDAAIKTVTLPIQVVKDVVDVANSKEPTNTRQAVEDIFDDIFGY